MERFGSIRRLTSSGRLSMHHVRYIHKAADHMRGASIYTKLPSACVAQAYTQSCRAHARRRYIHKAAEHIRCMRTTMYSYIVQRSNQRRLLACAGKCGLLYITSASTGWLGQSCITSAILLYLLYCSKCTYEHVTPVRTAWPSPRLWHARDVHASKPRTGASC